MSRAGAALPGPGRQTRAACWIETGRCSALWFMLHVGKGTEMVQKRSQAAALRQGGGGRLSPEASQLLTWRVPRHHHYQYASFSTLTESLAPVPGLRFHRPLRRAGPCAGWGARSSRCPNRTSRQRNCCLTQKHSSLNRSSVYRSVRCSALWRDREAPSVLLRDVQFLHGRREQVRVASFGTPAVHATLLPGSS